ncbi:kinesin-domain-containing protein [Macrolepiota fuliginosa MF-IS2]|uniref:Kinesin-like protein n=1 Tax=Macrolepiota fuliginosa MF-IS2 TaxID=1400762 RepID=A0A9P5XBU1_9AGAR|nr:kinesin-domain-containing protein [Macrolepiota fuliginosa MF-IS2]
MASHGIKIAARLRPALAGEIIDENIVVHHASDDSSGSTKCSYVSVVNPRDITQVFKFPFSSCYDQESTQEEIFYNDVEPLLDVVYRGVTVTIFAYGVTSSGKTHTMQGTRAEPGVIPRTVQALFDRQNQHPQYQISFAMSYMELYKDEPYDLLVTRENAPKLPVREDGNGMVFVANLSSIPLASMAEFDAIYNQATKNRSIGATNLNRASSRSHAILTIEVIMVDTVEQRTLTGKINLVDLAGSENNKLTGNDPSRMAESKAINQSLSVLGQVVHALNQGANRIPYRNSKLTRLLQDALGGSSMGLLICNLAPGTKFRQDTLNTLNFATRTKNVENKPVINERDNRPAPKPHFAAPPAPKLAPTVLQQITTAGSSSVPGPSTSTAVGKARASLAPGSGPVHRSRVPRVSTVGVGGAGFQRFAFPGGGRRSLEGVNEKASISGPGGSGLGLTEKDIEEKIMRVVEAEVAKRLAAEREKDEEERRVREKEEEERRAAREKELAERVQSSPTKRSASLPSGVLTPLLKKHRDLDDELRARLHDLERKLDQGHKETSLAGVLSPVSKKKTGRAYVSLARAYSEKGKLEDALELYRRAEAYVPDNVKLKERIIELEWAVKNNKDFVPSPKPPRKEKKKGRKGNRKSRESENVHIIADGNGNASGVFMQADEDIVKPASGGQACDFKPGGSSATGMEFGMEITNTTYNGNSTLEEIAASGSSPRLSKRLFVDVEEGNPDRGDGGDDGIEDIQTPPKKMKFGGLGDIYEIASEDEVEEEVWGELPSAPVKGKRATIMSS